MTTQNINTSSAGGNNQLPPNLPTTFDFDSEDQSNPLTWTQLNLNAVPEDILWDLIGGKEVPLCQN